MNAIAGVLEHSGFHTFLPHRDGLERYLVRFSQMPVPSIASGIRSRIDYAIFALDVYELLERCSAVVCNLNGRVPDEGMIVEAALAYACGQPLVMFKNDLRAPFGGYDNSMLTSLCRGNILQKLTDLPDALTVAISRKQEKVAVSGNLKKAIAHGKRISSILEHLPDSVGTKKWPEAVLTQVMAVFDDEPVEAWTPMRSGAGS